MVRGCTYHSAISDQPDQCIRRQHAQTSHQRLTQRLELILVHTRVDDVQEYRRDLRRAREGVLDGGVFGQELGWEIGSGNILVVRWERVALQAKGADPHLAADIDLTVACQFCSIALWR